MLFLLQCPTSTFQNIKYIFIWTKNNQTSCKYQLTKHQIYDESLNQPDPNENVTSSVFKSLLNLILFHQVSFLPDLYNLNKLL